MSGNYEEYQREAVRCMDMAGEAETEKLRATWLHLAEKWLSMIPGKEKTASEKFDDAVDAKGTHQKDSDASH